MIDLFSSFGLGPLLVLLAAGVGIGLIGGLLGIGGGVVAVPILLEVFGTRALSDVDRSALAIGTSQAVILLSSLAAVWAHGMGGRIDAAILRAWTGPMILGALIGLVLAPFTPPSLSLTGFAVIALLLGAKMLLGDRVVLADELPKGPRAWISPLLIGLFSADLGVGAGTLTGPVLGLFRVPLKRVVGAGAAFNLAVAFPSMIAFIVMGLGRPGLPVDAIGYVSVGATTLLAVPAMLAAPAAARLAGRMSPRLLGIIFALCLFAIAARLVYRAFVG
jgi:uncharacterized membrane protein YfcA